MYLHNTMRMCFYSHVKNNVLPIFLDRYNHIMYIVYFVEPEWIINVIAIEYNHNTLDVC